MIHIKLCYKLHSLIAYELPLPLSVSLSKKESYHVARDIWNSLCSPAWYQACSPASASQVLDYK